MVLGVGATGWSSWNYVFTINDDQAPPSTHVSCMHCCFALQLLASKRRSAIIGSYHVSEPRTPWASLGARITEAAQGGRADVAKVVAKAESVDDGVWVGVMCDTWAHSGFCGLVDSSLCVCV